MNGAETTSRIPVAILNREPIFNRDPNVSLTVPHGRSSPCALAPFCYSASGKNPFSASDPDGDLLNVELVAGNDSTTVFSADQSGNYVIATDAARPMSFRNANGETPFSVTFRASDPWSTSSQSFTPVILNAPPRVSRALGFPTFEDPEDDVVYLEWPNDSAVQCRPLDVGFGNSFGPGIPDECARDAGLISARDAWDRGPELSGLAKRGAFGCLTVRLCQ